MFVNNSKYVTDITIIMNENPYGIEIINNRI
jgi:hypothetical protein